MVNITVFASGRGSNFRQIFYKIEEGAFPARICALITDNSSADALKFAVENSIPTFIIHPRDFASALEFGNALLKPLIDQKTDWVVLAGYLKKIPDNVIDKFENRILNIHPALLPSFGGKGMYGDRVHQAVFRAGSKISGVTVHLVNKEYDKGPIVMQKSVDIADCSTASQIAGKVLKVEHALYWQAVKKLVTQKFRIDGNRIVFE